MGRVLAGVAVAAVAAASGCSGGEEIDTSTLDLPFATYASLPTGGQAQSLDGTLELEAGCVLVREGSTAVVAVLRSGATWDAATQTITVGTAQVTLGSAAAELTGSLFAERPADILVPPSCPRIAEYFVVTHA